MTPESPLVQKMPSTGTSTIRNKDGNEVEGTDKLMRQCQGPCLDCIRPGQWCVWVKCHANNLVREKWMIKGLTKAKISEALENVAKIDNFTDVSVSKSGTTFSARWYTPIKQWLDKVHIQIAYEGDEVHAHASSVSVAVCPSSCPGALPCSILFCWFPFLDHGKNALHLSLIKRTIEDAGGEITFEELHSSTCTKKKVRRVTGESMDR